MCTIQYIQINKHYDYIQGYIYIDLTNKKQSIYIQIIIKDNIIHVWSLQRISLSIYTGEGYGGGYGRSVGDNEPSIIAP